MATSGKSYKWETWKPMPTKRVFSTALQAGEQLFVIGGCDRRGVPIDNLESFNSKRWDKLLNMPTPRAGVAAVSIGNLVLTFGGVNVRQEPVDVTEIYDPKAKKWLPGIDTMREKLLGLSAVVKDDKAVVVGGMGFDTNPKDFFMEYNPETNKWGSLAPINVPRYATFSFLVDERLYVLGGRQGKMPVAALEAYDFREGKWQQLQDIPSKRVFALYSSSSDKLFSLGGLNEDAKKGFTDTTEVFEISAGKWRTGQNMTDKRADFAAAVIDDNTVVVAGGLGSEGKPLANAETYDVSNDCWTPLPAMSGPHCSCAYTKFKDNFHVIGGLTIGGPSNAVEYLIPGKD